MATTAADTIASGGPRPVAGTLTQLFFDAVERYDAPEALQVKIGGEYRAISHRTLAERVRRVALGLQARGVRPGDRVSILSENRPEWVIADLGCLTAGITNVPLYPTLPSGQMEYILRDAGAVAIFVSTEAHASTISRIRAEVPALRQVIGFGEKLWPGVDVTLTALEAAGAARETDAVIARYREDAMRVKPDDLATLIYTSGTTGEPKGVMLTHDNIFSNAVATLSTLPITRGTSLSFLPLSHVFERVVGYYLMLAAGVSIAYAESLDTVPANMLEVKPTIVVSVPRLYEKMYGRVLENALSGGAIKKRIFFWARRTADRWAESRLGGRNPAPVLAFKYRIAQKLVFSKLKARTGGRLRYFVSGGAPLASDINKFFYAAGLTILEGYGLTESSPVIACNTPENFRIGTVGKPIPGVEVKIASDGEILTRGPHVMKGYYNAPEATRDAIDPDGWLHTGDIGELRDGFLAITDRKKDIIVTAGGKNIAPQRIENQVKTNKYVSQVVMIGDKRRYPVVVVVPNFDHLEKWAKIKNLLWTDRRQLINLPLVNAKMEKEVLSKLQGLASFETPKKVGLLEADFSIESGELTPTQKVKRRVIEQRYKALIDGLYADNPVQSA